MQLLTALSTGPLTYLRGLMQIDTAHLSSEGNCYRFRLWSCDSVARLLHAMQGMDSYASFEGTILEVRRTYIRVVFSRAASDRMEARPARGTWRIDRYSPETTYQRQLKVNQQRLCMTSALRHRAASFKARQKSRAAIILCTGHPCVLQAVFGTRTNPEQLHRRLQV